ncbi:MAG: DNA polymerase III subunit epsilon [Burkholderiales bacterium]
MRQIILDTETTGLDPALGHRVIEVAALELADRRLTGNTFQRYVNPERAIDAGAQQVHGLTDEMLADKPKFKDIADELLAFITGAELIIHNAPFDVGFLDREFALLKRKPLAHHCPVVIDTLRMARDLHPGKRNSLDALCERYQIDHSSRTLHGALLDAELLAEVYLAMTRGQNSLIMDVAPTAADGLAAVAGGMAEVLALAADAEELAAHAQYLAELDKASKGKCVWLKLEKA